MKRCLLLIALGAVIGCDESTAPPSPLYPGYFLSSVDGKLLPVPLTDDGVMLMANTLVFDTPDRPRAGTAVDGLVRYILDVRRPDHFVAIFDAPIFASIRWSNKVRVSCIGLSGKRDDRKQSGSFSSGSF